MYLEDLDSPLVFYGLFVVVMFVIAYCVHPEKCALCLLGH